MPIALQDLRRRLCRAQAEAIERILFHFGGHVRVCAHGAGELADAQLVAAVLQSLAVASHLRDEDRQLVAKGRRLGVDAVGAADGERVLVAHRQLGQDLFQLAKVFGQDVRGLLDLQRQRRIQDVRGGQAEMNPPCWRADSFGDGSGERDHVVVRFAQELGRTFGLDCRTADDRHVLLRNDADVRPGLADGQLDLEPQLHAMLVGPYAAHRRARVAWDHGAATTPLASSRPMSRRACLPAKRIVSAASYMAWR